MTTQTPSRRERARAATITEIKDTALELMRSSGSTDLKFSDIAREMGMTAPALYRYFADSGALLTELIVDAYDDLGRFVASARDTTPPQDPSARLLATAQAYRQWATSEPQRFALILGMPVPGYTCPDEGPTTEAAKRAMGQLQSLFVDAARVGLLGEPLITDVADAFTQCILEAHENDLRLPGAPPADAGQDGDDAALSPASFQAMLSCWAVMHGFTSLEAYGHLDWLTPQARDALFVTNIRLAARAAGLPDPAPQLGS